jgi:hypothetical protein
VPKGKGLGPTFPHQEAAERTRRGLVSPLPSFLQNCILKFQYSLLIERRWGGGSSICNPTHLTATDGDIWQEGGGAKKIPINLNLMMVTINSTTNVHLNGKCCLAFGHSLRCT